VWDNEGDATRCARGHAPRMPTACLLGSSNLFFQKTLIFRKSLQICGQVEAKAKASPHGHATKRLGHAAAKTRTCSQGQGSPMGMQPRPRQPPWACCQGQGMQQPRPRQPPMGRPPRPRHATTKASIDTIFCLPLICMSNPEKSKNIISSPWGRENI